MLHNHSEICLITLTSFYAKFILHFLTMKHVPVHKLGQAALRSCRQKFTNSDRYDWTGLIWPNFRTYITKGETKSKFDVTLMLLMWNRCHVSHYCQINLYCTLGYSQVFKLLHVATFYSGFNKNCFLFFFQGKIWATIWKLRNSICRFISASTDNWSFSVPHSQYGQ